METSSDAYRNTVALIMDRLIESNLDAALYAYALAVGVTNWNPPDDRTMLRDHRYALIHTGLACHEKGLSGDTRQAILDSYEPGESCLKRNKQ